MIELGQASATTTITAGLASIDLGKWLFTLTSDEYAACAEGHQSAAQGHLPSGKRVSINVERVGAYFMVQHYIERITERDHVQVVSPNTVMWIDDERYVLTQITWELRVEALDDTTCRLTCLVIAETDNAGFAEQAAANNRNIPSDQTPFQRHIDEETPLFGKDIERKANAGTWAANA